MNKHNKNSKIKKLLINFKTKFSNIKNSNPLKLKSAYTIIKLNLVLFTKVLLIALLLAGQAEAGNKNSKKTSEKRQTNQNKQHKKIKKEKAVEQKTEIMNEEKEKPVYQTAVLAGGCFWGIEELMGKQNGVIKTEVGYTGGAIENPTYDIVKTGISGHAESVRITFDKNVISYEKLLKFFLTIHDPTQENRQQNDIGSQYRSEIFYANDYQKMVAEDVLLHAKRSGVFKKTIVTRISKLGKFFPAEEYHQNYLQKNPEGYTCHFQRKEWIF